MELDRILGGLRPSEKSAIATLESMGWSVMYDCKIEDGRNPDGSRRRTFMRRGRYDLALMLKRSDGRALPPEPEGSSAQSADDPKPDWADSKATKKAKRK